MLVNNKLTGFTVGRMVFYRLDAGLGVLLVTLGPSAL